MVAPLPVQRLSIQISPAFRLRVPWPPPHFHPREPWPRGFNLPRHTAILITTSITRCNKIPRTPQSASGCRLLVITVGPERPDVTSDNRPAQRVCWQAWNASPLTSADQGYACTPDDGTSMQHLPARTFLFRILFKTPLQVPCWDLSWAWRSPSCCPCIVLGARVLRALRGSTTIHFEFEAPIPNILLENHPARTARQPRPQPHHAPGNDTPADCR